MNVIYDDDLIIGYSDDIVTDIINNFDGDDDDLILELVDKLEELDRELVYISYHPMGAYTCYKLDLGKELFVV